MTPELRKQLFETLYKNRHLYKFASTVPFAGQWRIWQRLTLPRIRGLDVLELGCGLGDLLADMLKAGYQARAVEHSPEMVAAARATLQRRQVGDPTCVIQGSAQSLPFSNSSFDTVVSTFPTEYIFDPDTIIEIQRVLRPGGRVIIIGAANLLPVGFLQPLLVLLQTLVYGPSALSGPSRHRSLPPEKKHSAPDSNDHTLHIDTASGTDITTEEVPAMSFGSHIPLERAGLRRRSERVYSRRWEVYITIGEKA